MNQSWQSNNLKVELLVGVRTNPLEKLNILKMKNVDLTDRSESLRSEVAEQTNIPKDAFDLIYGGAIIEDETPLEAYGIKNGSLIHFLKKKEVEKTAASTASASDSEPNIKMLISVFQSFIGIPLLQLAMRHMTKRPEVIENIISSSPGLSEDAVAIAILHDPDLIVHFNNAETIRKIAKLHPSLLEAAQHIASAVHDEAHNLAASANLHNNTANAATTGHSYSLENLSDDEEMAGDSSQSSDSPQPSNSANQSRIQSNRLSVADFFAAITRAQRSNSNNGGTGSASTASSSSVSRSNSNSGGVITVDFFNEAMQRAIATTPSLNNDSSNSQSQPPSASFTPPNSSSGSSNDMQRQISIMHEMGLLNDAINLQALQITNGDVQAAIELVLNGFGDN
ncbi:ubiquitin-like protein 7 [Nasonia vitripennis]|uniref:Ubiquitin-like protein 7 n=1 Tax=Nasonia vitripennis TaxID=7425 RepID=A0A7M7H9U3_NASVI|nr:ubiquitin-like protein 7 [Nasonia vitripennis]XP_008215428.1 ubiquitin-like protein 7 [Nasonia vitripennis]